MFGNNKPFGTTTPFGTSTFGGTTTTPFGQPSPSTAFGAKPATGNVFGGTSFGAAAPAPTGLFGNTAPATGPGLFGQQTSTNAFGQPTSTSGGSFAFGGTSASGGLFGSQAPAAQPTGLFGGTTNTSAFGSPRNTFGGFGTSTTTNTGLFGQPSNTGTALFGAGGFVAPPTSGTTVKFNPPTGTDTMMKGGVTTNINTRHQCISCMKEYETKSLEELRLEDYLANRKGPQQQVGMGGFGAPASQGLFAPAASTSGFSFGTTTQSKPLFGTTGATNTFGQTNTGLFGQTNPQQQQASMFGKTVGFGTATTSAPTAFNFGANTSTGLFGQTNQQKPMFGQQTTNTGLFGQPATTQAAAFGTGGFGTFGATTQPSTSLFGAKPVGFGTTSTATTNTFSFGTTPTANTSLFGQKPAAPAFGTTTGFGTTQPGFGTFGATTGTNTSLFGQTKPLTTGFGTTGTAFGSTLNSGFGTGFGTTMGMNTNTGTGLFGSNLNNKPTFSFGGTGASGFTFGQPNAAGTGFGFGANPMANAGTDPNALNQQLLARALQAYTTTPFGDNPLFQNGFQETRKKEDLIKPTNPTAQKTIMSSQRFKISPLPSTKIKAKSTPLSNGKVTLFDGLDDDDDPNPKNTSFIPKRSIKKLVLKSPPNTPSFTVMSNITSVVNTPTEINVSTSISILKTPVKETVGDGSLQATPLTIDVIEENPARPRSSTTIPNVTYTKLPTRSPEANLNDTIAALHTRQSTPNVSSGQSSILEESRSDRVSPFSSVISSDGDGDDSTVISTPSTPHGTGIKLTGVDYYTIPTLDEILLLKDDDGNCFVDDFVIGRHGYGRVQFLNKVNVANLNLDEIVIFQRKEITVYPDDSKKPPVNEGLNQRAEVELNGVWPTDKTTHSPVKDSVRLSLMGYKEKIMQTTSRLGATFIDYKIESGTWIFRVEHFSKYGLEDSDDEGDEPKKIPKPKTTPLVQQPPLTASGFFLKNQMASGSGSGDVRPILTEEDEMYSSMAYGLSQCMDDDQEMRDVDDIPQIIVQSPTTRQLVVVSAESDKIQGMKDTFFYEPIDTFSDEETEPKHFGALKIMGNFVKPVAVKKQALQAREGFQRTEDTLRSSVTFAEDLGITVPPPAQRQTKKKMSQTLQSIILAREEIWATLPNLSAGSDQTVDKLATMGRKIRMKPFHQSLMYKKQKCLADMGLFMGRSFRVGWASGQTLLHLGPVQSHMEPDDSSSEDAFFMSRSLPSVQSSLIYNPFTVTMSKVVSLSCGNVTKVLKNNLVEMMLVQLKHSESAAENNVPIFVPKPGIEVLHAQLKLSKTHFASMVTAFSDRDFIKQCHDVWELCVSLWGEIPGLEANRTVSAYAQQMARREALSSWLINSTKDRLQSEINNFLDPSNYLAVIFSHLCSRQVSKAVHLAHESNDHCLATLLAQAEGNAIVKRLIGKQLVNWDESGASNLIHKLRLKLYVLLAGAMVWETSEVTINCCDHLDWRRALALHLWYYCFPTSSIKEAILNYEMSFSDPESTNRYAQPPWPPYIKDDSEIDQDEHQIYDTCYHLLKLYCDRSYRLEKLLMPETYSPSHSDYRLSWLLHQSLLAVGYCHLPCEKASSLHLKFASQLENIGLWHWAVFVILHLPEEEMREKYVKDILLRYLSLRRSDENEEREAFLLEKLHVPPEWILQSKATIARSCGQFADEAHYLLKAGCWSQSHEIVISKLASDAIINENYEYLLEFLRVLAPPDRSETILDWASGGQVFLDYIHISKLVESIVKGEASVFDVDELQPEVISLCHRLSSLRCPSSKDRLCQSEMAKKTATLLRVVFCLQAERSGMPLSTYTLAPHIKSLPMPEDYLIQELRALSYNYLTAVAAE